MIAQATVSIECPVDLVSPVGWAGCQAAAAAASQRARQPHAALAAWPKVPGARVYPIPWGMAAAVSAAVPTPKGEPDVAKPNQYETWCLVG